jgi:hypothetical protein
VASARNHIASDYDQIYFGLRKNIKDCLQGWKVPMNIVDGGDTHDLHPYL